MDLYLQFTTQEMKTVVIHECNLYAFMSVCMHVREFVCMCVATNAPDHPVYMMCIRFAYAHACVRACVCGLVCICIYTSIVDFTC